MQYIISALAWLACGMLIAGLNPQTSGATRKVLYAIGWIFMMAHLYISREARASLDGWQTAGVFTAVVVAAYIAAAAIQRKWP